MGKFLQKWFSGMDSWWRVLKGVKPYRWMVVLSMICALGVGLSYASGVAVMLPVMKVFMSVEGLRGWTNRTAAENRTGLDLWDYDTVASIATTPKMVIREISPKKAPPQLL